MSKNRFTLTAKGGKRYTVSVPDATTRRPNCYLFAFVKSGSTLMDNMIADYCAAVGVPHFSLFDQAFAQGVRTADIQSDALQCFERSGMVYSGFRHYPAFDLPIEDSSVILLVRDPRDMLVSLYFSIMKSHVIPAGNEGLRRQREQIADSSIDEFVLKRAGGLLRTFGRYREKLEGTRCRTFRYEDVIYDKRNWLDEMVEFSGLPRAEDELERIARRHDIVPAREDVSRHIRQVHPGNFRKKLSEETVELLNGILAEFLDTFRYERS